MLTISALDIDLNWASSGPVDLPRLSSWVRGSRTKPMNRPKRFMIMVIFRETTSTSNTISTGDVVYWEFKMISLL